MHKFASACALFALFALAGCAGVPCGFPHAYYSNTAGPPLKAPAGMSVPPSDPDYSIPGETPSTGKPTDLDASGACIVLPPQVIKPASSSATPAQPAESGAGSAKPTQEPRNPAPAAGTHATPAVASGQPIG